MDRFSSRRSVVMAPNGMVVTSQPLAAQAGLRILMAGGNAVDAAVATAAVLNVVEPISTGIGGDVFGLIWDGKRLHSLNGSGRSPAALSLDYLHRQGHTTMPQLGPLSISVAGTADGWCEAVERFGRLGMADVLAPAIEYAEKGFPVSPIIARGWSMNAPKLIRYSGQDGGGYLIDGRAPRAGEVWRQPALARTFRAVAEGGRKAFYQGPIAQAIAATIQAAGGVMTEADLAVHTSTWEEPISVDYRGVRLYETPPNGQGMAALIALQVAKGWDLSAMGFGSVAALHHLLEAMKIGWADTQAYVADPAFAPAPLAQLLSAAYGDKRRAEVRPDKASVYAAGRFASGSDTVYLTVVDKDRMAVSFINSNYAGIGSGLVVRDWGIALQNRAALFVLEEGHPNVVEPGKRPYHTIIPAMAFRDGRPWLSYGVMGGYMQPQGHVQVLTNMVDFGMHVQDAMDAPRWNVDPLSGDINIEEGLAHSLNDLSRLGHRVTVTQGNTGPYGGGQVIMIDPETNMLHGGSDPRKDGCAVGY